MGRYSSLKKQHAPDGVHVPNKNEGILLRRLMAESGLSETEIRAIKKYRIMLSEAQDAGEKYKGITRKDRTMKSVMKSVTQDLKLAKEHPLVIAEFKKRWEEKVKYDVWLR